MSTLEHHDVSFSYSRCTLPLTYLDFQPRNDVLNIKLLRAALELWYQRTHSGKLVQLPL